MVEYALFATIYELLVNSPIYSTGRVVRNDRNIVGLDQTVGQNTAFDYTQPAAVVRFQRIEQIDFAFPANGTSGIYAVDVEDYYPANKGEPDWESLYLIHCSELADLLNTTSLAASNAPRVRVVTTPPQPVKGTANVVLWQRRVITVTRKER